MSQMTREQIADEVTRFQQMADIGTMLVRYMSADGARDRFVWLPSEQVAWNSPHDVYAEKTGMGTIIGVGTFGAHVDNDGHFGAAAYLSA